MSYFFFLITTDTIPADYRDLNAQHTQWSQRRGAIHQGNNLSPVEYVDEKSRAALLRTEAADMS